jgi:hypothetical protein
MVTVFVSYQYKTLKQQNDYKNMAWQDEAKDAAAYLEYVQETGIRDYLSTVGNISAKILRKIDGDICHFYTITEWNDIESIINFAGNDYEKARYYPEDKEYLLEFEETVVLAP